MKLIVFVFLSCYLEEFHIFPYACKRNQSMSSIITIHINIDILLLFEIYIWNCYKCWIIDNTFSDDFNYDKRKLDQVPIIQYLKLVLQPM